MQAYANQVNSPPQTDRESGTAPRGAFRGRVPQIIACALPSEDCAPKESNRPGATGVHFGPVPPQNTACAPPKRE